MRRIVRQHGPQRTEEPLVRKVQGLQLLTGQLRPTVHGIRQCPDGDIVVPEKIASEKNALQSAEAGV